VRTRFRAQLVRTVLSVDNIYLSLTDCALPCENLVRCFSLLLLQLRASFTYLLARIC
jgi:hypothetical protein